MVLILAKEIPSYLYESDSGSNYSRVTSDLLMSKSYQELSHAARAFYIVLVTHKHTKIQSETLFNSLKEYYERLGIEKTKEDLQGESDQWEKWHGGESKKFVIPEKQLKEYGYSSAYASKLKRELIEKGFIKVFANRKGKGAINQDYSKSVTIYEFSNAWKK